MNAREIQTLVLSAKNTGEPVPERLEIGDIRIETNFGHYEVKDAVWERYSLDDKYNSCGDNGAITGLVVRGGETSRLFHVTSFQDEAGTRKTWNWAPLHRMYAVNGTPWKGTDGIERQQDLTPYISLVTCG